MSSDVHAAVYLVDPRFRNHPIEARDVQDGERFLKKFVGNDWEEFKQILDKFNNNEGLFKEWNYQIHDDPKIPWGMLKRVNGYQKYAEYCKRLVSICATSVGLERSFSVVRTIHTKLRNKLSPTNLQMLVYCYWNMRVLDKN